MIKRQKNNIKSQRLSDLILLANHFLLGVKENECQSAVPISIWIQIEDLINTLEIVSVDEEDYYSSSSQNNESQNFSNIENDPFEISDENKSISERIKNQECAPCNPLVISTSYMFKRPDIEISLNKYINIANTLLLPRASIACPTVVAIRDNCPEDIIRLLGTLIMSLRLLVLSFDISSISVNGLIKASIGAALSLVIRDASFMFNFSIKRSECFSNYIEKIIDAFINNDIQELREEGKVLKSKIIEGYSSIDNKLNSVPSGISINTSNIRELKQLKEIVDSSISRVNEYISNIANIGLFINCGNSTDDIFDRVDEIIRLVNVINTMAVSLKFIKNKKRCSGADSFITDNDIVSIISEISEIDSIVQDGNGEIIGVIVSEQESGTFAIDPFGCNITSVLDEIITDSSNTNNNQDTDQNTSEENDNTTNEDNLGIIDNVYYLDEDNNRRPINYNTVKPSLISISQIDDFINDTNRFIPIIDIIDEIENSPENSSVEYIQNNDNKNKDELFNVSEDSSTTEESIEDFINNIQKQSFNIKDIEGKIDGC